MNDTKTFPVAVVLAVTTGRVLCSIEQIYDVVNWITGDNIYTHQIPRAMRFGKPILEKAYPELAKADSPSSLSKLATLLECADHRNNPDARMEACRMWVDWLREPCECNLKAEYAVESQADAWLSIDPVDEMQSMLSKDQNLVVIKQEAIVAEQRQETEITRKT